MSTSALPPLPLAKLKAQFDSIVAGLEAEFLTAPAVDANSWQSTKAPQPMPELFNRSISFDLNGVDAPTLLARAFRPNLPWADIHFYGERVSGRPLNPGRSWRIWPYAQSAAKHRVGQDEDEDPPFDHSYAERYWPKYAGMTKGGEWEGGPFEAPECLVPGPIQGIRDEYGDLADLLHNLQKDPLTRQAYLPVWFPEDLMGARNGRRVPCTLGYHFIRRDDRLHIIYPMRSCDFVRHFRDDVYLTALLLVWVLRSLQKMDSTNWRDVTTGTFTMHITSLHMFQQDQDNLRLKHQGALK